jgi:hypothetical protein
MNASVSSPSLLRGERMTALLASSTPQRQHEAPHADAAKE